MALHSQIRYFVGCTYKIARGMVKREDMFTSAFRVPNQAFGAIKEGIRHAFPEFAHILAHLHPRISLRMSF